MGMVKKFEFAHVAEGIARQAGALLRGFYEKGVATEYKGDVDLVTEADRASEALIGEKLTAAFPAHGIYGEEGTRRGWRASFGGMSIRWMGRRTLRMGFRRSAWCWGWSGARLGWRRMRMARWWRG